MKTLILSTAISLTLLTACTPVTATRGNLLEEYELKEVLPGIDGKDDVVRKIGSPTTVAAFDDNTWYYMGRKTEKKGILDPKVVEEKIVVVTFDSDGKVGAVKERRDGYQDIPIVQRTTPVSGNEFTFIQQMIGNVGKFNKQGNESASETAGGKN
jgi:outer membrane protein assembly factor BamE (lipoprotein component of BamABCDE complex)